MTELEEFAAQTGGEHYQRGAGDTVKASSHSSNPMAGVETNDDEEEVNDEDEDMVVIDEVDMEAEKKAEESK